MKKNLLTTISSLLVTVLFFFSCQKEIKESPAVTGPESQSQRGDDDDRNECRLKYFEWQYSATQQFHYNRKGLADRWTIDYGDFGVIEETMFYDNKNRLIKANEDYFGTDYVYLFFYTDKRLTRVTRTNVDNPDDMQDWRYTYNHKGQNIRQDDAITDAHVFITYDAMGNNTKTDIYFGNELWYSDNYTFSQPVRNPLLAVPGIDDLGFPFYGTGNFSDKRLFTSNRTVIYDNGVPYVYNDYDPTQTIIQTGSQNYPVTASYYDMISERNINNTYGYENCGRKHDDDGYTQGKRNRGSNKSAGYATPLLFKGSAKSMKEQIQKLREQIIRKGK